MMDAYLEANKELIRARSLFSPFHSAHEGYAVLLEEVDELWTEVKKHQSKRDLAKMHTEAIQVAAMALRFAEDVCPITFCRDGVCPGNCGFEHEGRTRREDMMASNDILSGEEFIEMLPADRLGYVLSNRQLLDHDVAQRAEKEHANELLAIGEKVIAQRALIEAQAKRIGILERTLECYRSETKASVGAMLAGAKRIEKLWTALLHLHNQVDLRNGQEGDDSKLCLLCHSRVYDAQGILHEASCGVVEARQVMGKE